MRDVVVWYDSPEAVHEAFTRDIERASGESLDGAVWGGEDADGNAVDLTVEQIVEGLRFQGLWGFCDGERIHAWIAPDVSVLRVIGFFAHELAHLRGADAPPIAAEHESWAELVRSIAEEAYTLATARRMREGVSDA